MAHDYSQPDPLDELSDDLTALHTESDRRDSYRYNVQGERSRGLLQIGLAEVPVEIVDESAGGFSVAFLEGPPCELNQTLLLRLQEHWIEVRVMNVRTEHKLRDDGETLLRTRLGLKRIRDLEEWEVLQWQNLKLAMVSDGLRKIRLKTLRRPLLTIVLPILGVLLAGAGVIWLLEKSAPSLEDLNASGEKRVPIGRLHVRGELPGAHSSGKNVRLPGTPELRPDQAIRALREADKINAKLKDKPVDALEATMENVPQADRLKSNKQKRTRRVRHAAGMDEAFDAEELDEEEMLDDGRPRRAERAAPPERAARLPAQEPGAGGKKKVSTWELLLAPPVIRKLELTPEQIQRINQLQADTEAGEDLPFGFIRDAQGQLVPDPRVAEVLNAEQLALWQELIEKIEPSTKELRANSAAVPQTAE